MERHAAALALACLLTACGAPPSAQHSASSLAISRHERDRTLHRNALSCGRCRENSGRHHAGADSSADNRGNNPADANPNPATDGTTANDDRVRQRHQFCF